MANRQLYSLWRRRRGTTRWERVEGCAPYTKEVAIRVFQDRLIRSAFDPDLEFGLRPVKNNGGI